MTVFSGRSYGAYLFCYRFITNSSSLRDGIVLCLYLICFHSAFYVLSIYHKRVISRGLSFVFIFMLQVAPTELICFVTGLLQTVRP